MSFNALKQKKGDERNKDMMKKHRRQVLSSGIITAVGELYLLVLSFSHVLVFNNFNLVHYKHNL